MARVRKIDRNPPKSRKNYFLVDACFLANKYIPLNNIARQESHRIPIRSGHPNVAEEPCDVR